MESKTANRGLTGPRGFTLLEVMIAVTILAFISLFTSRMIQQGLKAKVKIQAEIDRSTALTSVLQLMSKDVEQAFNYRDINTELFNAAQNERKKGGAAPAKKDPNDPNPSPPPPPPPPTTAPPAGTDPNDFALKEVKIYTRFFGEKDKLNFTSLNNFRTQKNLQQSDQIEVGYYLADCSGRIDKSKNSQCLWRRVSPYIDDDVKEGGKETVLIENVKSLTFRYLGEGNEAKWLETWLSENGEEIAKDKFPTAVEITLAITDTKAKPPKEIGMTIVSALRFPNNKKDPP